MTALTARQKEISEYLQQHIVSRGYAPTVREIGSHFGIRSPNGVMCHLKALESKGVIRRLGHKSRTITLTKRKFPYPLVHVISPKLVRVLDVLMPYGGEIS